MIRRQFQFANCRYFIDSISMMGWTNTKENFEMNYTLQTPTDDVMQMQFTARTPWKVFESVNAALEFQKGINSSQISVAFEHNMLSRNTFMAKYEWSTDSESINKAMLSGRLVMPNTDFQESKFSFSFFKERSRMQDSPRFVI